MCKEVDDTPQEKVAPPPKVEAPAPVKEESYSEEVSTTSSSSDKCARANFPVVTPEPSVYSMCLTGRDPKLLTSSDETTESIDISDFKSLNSMSEDAKIDRLPLRTTTVY